MGAFARCAGGISRRVGHATCRAVCLGPVGIGRRLNAAARRRGNFCPAIARRWYRLLNADPERIGRLLDEFAQTRTVPPLSRSAPACRRHHRHPCVVALRAIAARSPEEADRNKVRGGDVSAGLRAGAGGVLHTPRLSDGTTSSRLGREGGPDVALARELATFSSLTSTGRSPVTGAAGSLTCRRS